MSWGKNNLCTIISPCGNFARAANALGRGSSKIVFPGRDLKRNVPIAWCQPKRNNKDERENLKNESELLRQLNHPNVIHFFAFWDIEHEERNNSAALIIELMDQGSLDIYRRKFKEVSVDVYTRWSYDILLGLQYLHGLSSPIIHCDLKCANILVSGPPERLKIADFGLAATEVDIDKNIYRGTPNFMAPEAWKSKYSQASDIYAFGMCLAEMVTGRMPYEEYFRLCDIERRVVRGLKPKSFAKIREEKTIFLVEWCTVLDPVKRPTCSEILQSYFYRRMQQNLDQQTLSEAPIAQMGDPNFDVSDEPSTSAANNKNNPKYFRISRPTSSPPVPSALQKQRIEELQQAQQAQQGQETPDSQEPQDPKEAKESKKTKRILKPTIY